jgi:hypothetical protein
MAWMSDAPSSTSKPFWQFAIRSLLFAILCVAGFFAGFRVGYDRGAEKRRSEDFSTKVYSVSDFTSADEMISTIIRTIDIESWEDVGGPGKITGAPDDPASVIIYQTGANHDSIERLLTDLREAKK